MHVKKPDLLADSKKNSTDPIVMTDKFFIVPSGTDPV
jgi:hypothetical protein